MPTSVVKKDGTKESFDSGKIKNAIAMAITQGGLPEEEKTKVVERVFGAVMESLGAEEEIASSVIREKILSELDTVAPAASAAWRKYEQEQGKQEQGK